MAEGEPELYSFRLDGSPPSKLTDDLDFDDARLDQPRRTHAAGGIDHRRSIGDRRRVCGRNQARPHHRAARRATQLLAVRRADRLRAAIRRALPTTSHDRTSSSPNADGSAPRIVSSGTDPSWSPDGKTLLFKIWVESDESDEAGGNSWIATASVDGKTVTRLAPGVHPDWSPDGRRIAYMAETQGRTDIWVMDADGGGQTCLTCRY